jgi:hypothetical protein
MLQQCRTHRGRAFASLLLVGAFVALPACGGASADERIREPIVRAFSPVYSALDANGNQAPTFTNAFLTSNIRQPYLGEIVVFFNDDTALAPSSVFIGGDPNLGLDRSALKLTRALPTVGAGGEPVTMLVPVDIRSVLVDKTLIRIVPEDIANGNGLATGQYRIEVSENIRNVNGKRLLATTFHTFTVGDNDVIAPEVVVTSPVNQATGVGAGSPPPTPPAGFDPDDVAEVRTAIFGPTTPRVTVEFSEGIDRNSVTRNNIQITQSINNSPPQSVPEAAGFPELKSVVDGATLPSNGHEIVWEADQMGGGFNFDTVITVTIVGLYDTVASWDLDTNTGANPPANPDNASPIRDISGNPLLISRVITFQTIKPPNIPENPQPEWAIWFAASNRVGAIDTINQQGIAEFFIFGANGPNATFPGNVVPRNSWLDNERVLPQYTDTVATAQNIGGFEPTEINVDNRTNGGTCHTWIYAMSPNTGEIVIVNSRTSIPVAIISTPTPGGLGNQTGGGQAADILLVTNASANTLTAFDMSNATPGTAFLNGPIFIQNVRPTGNTPRAVTMSLSPTGSFNRDPFQGGPAVPLIMWVDFTDGVLNTTDLVSLEPLNQFNLGAVAPLNDVAMTPCFGLPPILFAAVSQGAPNGLGKISYYVAGPGCASGVSTGARPDSIVGTVDGFDVPAGLDNIFSVGNGAFFAVAESGTQANQVTTLGVEVGANNLPRKLNEFKLVGSNPVMVAHPTAWLPPLGGACIDPLGDGVFRCATNPGCWYRNIVETQLRLQDTSLAQAQRLYICAKGSSQVTVVNMVNGARDFYSPIQIPSVSYVASAATQ